MYMDVFLLILAITAWIAYALVSAMRPLPSPMSQFELQRRAKLSKKVKEALNREKRLGAVMFVQRLVVALLLLAGVSVSVIHFGWLGGILLSIFAIVVVNLLMTQKLISRLANDIYDKVEPSIIKMVIKADVVFRYAGSSDVYSSDRYRRLDSKEELINLVNESEEALSESQRRIISSTLEFAGKQVDGIMTPAKDIKSIKRDEFLGPLVLSEIHDLGHSRLPVIDKDIDHVVGILYLRDLLSLDIRDSTTAEKAMDKKVYYIHQHDTLEHALAAFLKVRHHLFVVINDERETVGLLSLEDVVESLIGQEIVDEDDHDDAAKVVASRKSTKNRPAGRVDV